MDVSQGGYADLNTTVTAEASFNETATRSRIDSPNTSDANISCEFSNLLVKW